jgi:hypothetical protein
VCVCLCGSHVPHAHRALGHMGVVMFRACVRAAASPGGAPEPLSSGIGAEAGKILWDGVGKKHAGRAGADMSWRAAGGGLAAGGHVAGARRAL